MRFRDGIIFIRISSRSCFDLTPYTDNQRCMEKCDSSGYDVNLALLALRSTSLTAELPSLTELLQQSLWFRTTVPTYVPDPSNSEFVKAI